jgi:hypothetical protein
MAVAAAILGGALSAAGGAPAAAAVPVPGSPASTLGVYAGARAVDKVAAFEAWSGVTPLAHALDYFPGTSWADMTGAEWLVEGWRGSPYRVVYSVPMLTNEGGTLAEGAAGAYNHHFVKLATMMVARGAGDAVIRPGWEFNGSWFRWTAKDNPAGFAEYFRQIVTSMRSVPGAAFAFDWTTNLGKASVAPDLAYPGDAYVDYIGMDVYDHSWAPGSTDPVVRWRDIRDQAYGLVWHRNFAAAHGKPMTYPEWALSERPDGHGGGDDPYYIEQMHNWIAANNVAYHNYFEFLETGTQTVEHRLQSGRFPHAAAKFRELFGGATGTATQAPAPTTPAPAPAPRSGYWMLEANGTVYAFGDARTYPGPRPAGVEDFEPTAAGTGYWLVNGAGHVFSYGTAPYLGGLGAGLLHPGERVTSMSATPSTKGYWLFTTLGRVFTFGDARFFGDMAGIRLNGPVLDSVPTSKGDGYYMVASDGGIFTFGAARFQGSMGGRHLNAPVQSLVPDRDGGYWLVASDGGVFAFDAAFRGSMGGIPLNGPVTGMVRYGAGYLMVATDGGIFNFSDKPFAGSLGGRSPANPIVAVAVLDR